MLKEKTGLLTENGYNSETKTFKVTELLHICYLFINKSSYFNPLKSILLLCTPCEQLHF